MCGITGFTGHSDALPILLSGLKSLEYRGYDSAGVTLVDENGLYTKKEKGRLDRLKELLAEDLHQHTGIGHTRWATTGFPVNYTRTRIPITTTRFPSSITGSLKIMRQSKQD